MNRPLLGPDDPAKTRARSSARIPDRLGKRARRGIGICGSCYRANNHAELLHNEWTASAIRAGVAPPEAGRNQALVIAERARLRKQAKAPARPRARVRGITTLVDYRLANEKVKPRGGTTHTVNPDRMGRGRRAHAITQNLFSALLRERGIKPMSPSGGPAQFDIAAWVGPAFVVVEVKSLTRQNEVQQLRLGLGEISDWWEAVRLGPARGATVIYPILAVEHVPTQRAYWQRVCRRAGVWLWWPGQPLPRVIRQARRPR